MVLIALVIFSLSLTGCQTRETGSAPNESTPIYRDTTDKDEIPPENNAAGALGKDENSQNTESPDTDGSDTPEKAESGQVKVNESPKGNSSSTKPSDKTENAQAGSTTNQKNNSGSASTEFTIDDYMAMNDSLESFTAFVNRRSDFSDSEKK